MIFVNANAVTSQKVSIITRLSNIYMINLPNAEVASNKASKSW